VGGSLENLWLGYFFVYSELNLPRAVLHKELFGPKSDKLLAQAHASEGALSEPGQRVLKQ
jgi:hypothetical protein